MNKPEVSQKIVAAAELARFGAFVAVGRALDHPVLRGLPKVCHLGVLADVVLVSAPERDAFKALDPGYAPVPAADGSYMASHVLSVTRRQCFPQGQLHVYIHMCVCVLRPCLRKQGLIDSGNGMAFSLWDLPVFSSRSVAFPILALLASTLLAPTVLVLAVECPVPAGLDVVARRHLYFREPVGNPAG
jgi:hypothetical protein